MRLGAHHVIDHAQPFAPQLEALGFPAVDIVTCFAGTKGHATTLAEVVAPEGHLGLIEGADGFTPADFGMLFQKAVSLHFELMFVRPRAGRPSIIRQHEILDTVAGLVEEGTLRSTLTRTLSPISAATLMEAHRLVEAGSMIGKVVVSGWPDVT